MTDWLNWLLGELEEEEDRGKDLDWNPYALPGRQEKAESREAENRRPEERAQAIEEGEEERADTATPPGTAAGKLLKTAAEGQSSQAEGDGEEASISIPLAVKRAQTLALEQAAGKIGTEPEWSWQEGTPTGTGDARTGESSRAAHWLPAGGERVRAEATWEDMERLAAAPGTGGDLYTAVRRAGTAVEQMRGLRQAGSVVIREPVLMGGQSTTPAELDRIFQRDARRYDGGFTLF